MSNPKCNLCGSEKTNIIFHGTRDIDNIDILKCAGCGLVRLSDFANITDGFYENSGMHQSNEITKMSKRMCMKDDFRRASFLCEHYADKDILDFGCGSGGFLKLAKNYAKSVAGVELEEETRESLLKDEILVKDNIDKFKEKFDVITMFHVIEHLVEPEKFLKKIREHLKENGELIIETPNADEALVSLYDCDAYKRFTYWGCHVYLYTTDTMERLLQESGFRVNWSRQIQRYPVTNHLYWLTNGKPGGQNIWKAFNSEIIEKEYERLLEKKNMCDTLLLSCIKV